MPRKSLKRTTRAAPQPRNLSRAAGAPAPASAAATAPRGFYNPEDVGNVQGSPLAAHAAGVRGQALEIEAGRSADPQLSEHLAEAPADLHSEIERIRKIRKPLGAFSQKLAIDQRRGYHRHWFNDSPGRISEALSNGWAHVEHAGQPIKRVVGAGRDNGALYAYAMEIPEVFWQEDMAARHAQAAAKIEALKASPFKAQPGSAKPSDKGKFYDPSESEAGPLQVVKAG